MARLSEPQEDDGRGAFMSVGLKVVSKLCPSGHDVRAPGRLWLEEETWTGCPPAECQFCGCVELDLTRFGCNYAWCTRCYRMSAPISAAACWAAMKIVREKAGNAQTWDPLAEMASLLSAASTEDARKAPLPDLGHAEALALRALSRCDRDVARALESLQAWAAVACVL